MTPCLELQMIRLALTIFLLVLAPLAMGALANRPDRCTLTAPNKNADKAIEQFGFLIGDFAISVHAWTDGQWSPPRPTGARWNGWYGLDGQVVYDEWFDPHLNNAGINVRHFDTEANHWKMMWISTADKRVQDMRAEMRNGKLTMWQVHPDRQGWKAEFIVKAKDRWERVSYVQDDQGNWQNEYRLVATRVTCGSQ